MRRLRDIETLPNTQKAQGLYELERNSSILRITNKHHLVQTEQEMQYARENSDYYIANDVAIRPCPPRARHGYFETERASRYDFGSKITRKFSEVKDDHPDAELLVAPWIESESSGILTANHLTLGPRHDGATGGKGAVQIALLPTDENSMADSFCYNRERAGIANESAYIEFVRGIRTPENVTITQLRGGPCITGVSRDYIPTQGVHVKQVIEFDEIRWTLLSWERYVKQIINKDQVVVYHKGGAVSSHTGIHCVLNNVAYVVTHRPHIGEHLKPSNDVGETDIDALLYGIKRGLTNDFDSTTAKHLVHLSLFALHNYAADHGAVSSYALGLGIASTWRLIAAACLGELRHAYRHVTLSPLGDLKELYGDNGNLYRESIYADAFALHDNELEAKLVTTARSYMYDFWAGGYGGTAWGQCALSALLLRDNMIRVVKRPTRKAITTLIETYNHAIHVAHNNGSPLSKFSICNYSPVDCMNYAANLDRRWLLTDAMPALCDLLVNIPAFAPSMPNMVSTWRTQLPMRDVATLMMSNEAYTEQRRWEAVACEVVGRTLGASSSMHERCLCKNCTPWLHEWKCIGRCYGQEVNGCALVCNVRRKRIALPPKPCMCDECLNAGEACHCDEDQTCKVCHSSKNEPCVNSSCEECNPPEDDYDEYENEGDDE